MASRAGATAGSGKGKNKVANEGSGAEEGVDSMMGRLNLLADETEVVEMSDDEDETVTIPVKWSLIGKVLSPSITHIQSIRAAMKPAWGNPKGLKCRPVKDNVFIADFANKVDMEKALEGSPWMVGRHAVLVQELDVKLRPSDVEFVSMMIWVRILNLPFEWMNNTKGLKIAKLIDKGCRLDVDESGDATGCFLRVRAAIPLDKPLRRWIATTRNKVEVRFNLQYEKLPFYCFSCGLIGHGDLECASPAARDSEGKLPFDRILRAPEERRRKLQSFSQAAASASWNSDSRERGGGNRAYTGSAASRTSHETSDEEALKNGEEVATSPAAKTGGMHTTSSRVAEISKKLFGPVEEEKKTSKKKRKPSAVLIEAVTAGITHEKERTGESDLSLALVLRDDGYGMPREPDPNLSSAGAEFTKKQKNDSSCKVEAAKVMQPHRTQ
jgi:hypothetical protein